MRRQNTYCHDLNNQNTGTRDYNNKKKKIFTKQREHTYIISVLASYDSSSSILKRRLYFAILSPRQGSPSLIVVCAYSIDSACDTSLSEQVSRYQIHRLFIYKSFDIHDSCIKNTFKRPPCVKSIVRSNNNIWHIYKYMICEHRLEICLFRTIF